MFPYCHPGHNPSDGPSHYRIPACSHGTPHRECDVPRQGRPAVTGRCASDRPPDEHRHGADRRLVGASRLHVAPAGVRRPRPARRGAMRGRDADEPTPHVLRTNGIAAAGSVAAAGRPPSREPLAMSAGRAFRADGRKRLAGSGAADGVPEGGAAAAPHRRHHGARHGPADHRESHHAVHRHQRPPRRPRGRSPPRGPAASSSSARTRSTKCSDGSKAGRE